MALLKDFFLFCVLNIKIGNLVGVTKQAIRQKHSSSLALDFSETLYPLAYTYIYVHCILYLYFFFNNDYRLTTRDEFKLLLWIVCFTDGIHKKKKNNEKNRNKKSTNQPTMFKAFCVLYVCAKIDLIVWIFNIL